MKKSDFIVLDKHVNLLSEGAVTAARELWKMYYLKLRNSNCLADRAIWITNLFPVWFGVKPGSPNDDETDEVLFCFSAIVDGLDKIRDECRQKKLKESEYKKQMQPFFDSYISWLTRAIIDAWHSPSIQKMHEQLEPAPFGIYSTPIDDLHDVSQMTWIGGDKLT